MTAEPNDTIRVLVVDDHAVVRRGLLAFLDGEPDLDVVADAEGGAQALEAVRRLDSIGKRPHVVVHAALRAGASGFLLKDADADEVAVAVRAAHRGELQLDPAVAHRLTASLRAATDADEAARLTSRERDVLRLLAKGEANKEIAAGLGISERTARTHVSNILSKLRLNSRTQAALWATREGLAASPPGQDAGR
jgi:DNA-binding NarL/FixJ family response regulator